MKSITTILAGSIALALTGSAFAANVEIVITGSTAFRGQTQLAICKLLTSPTAVYKGSSLSGANSAIIRGTIGADTVTFKTAFTGSVGGVQTVSQSVGVLTLADAEFATATAVIANGTSLTGGAATANSATVSLVPDIAMSDTFQNSTPFTATTLVDTTVGVAGFKWVASNGAPAGLSNINNQLAQALWSNGSLPLALFTNVVSDEGSFVFATGRDPDSGTRLTAFAESGVGVFSQVVQYKPVVSGSAVTSQAVYPAQTINGIPVGQGNGGESSGSSLAGFINKSCFANINGYYITYLSSGDAATALGGATPGKELTYNGTAYSTAAIQNGQYTFWCYEHLMYRSTLSGTAKTIADAVATQIKNVDSPILLSTMRVSRPTDGASVTNVY